MRTKTLLLTAALSAAGIASSMAQAVYSVNAVGYVNTALLPGFNLVSNPLDNKTGNTIGNLFGTGLSGGTIPDGFAVYYFDPAIDDYVTALYESILGGWQPASAANQVIPPGEGAFVFWPGSSNGTNTFVGEVLQQAASNQQIPPGFSIKGSTVPIEGTVTSMNFPVADGDSIYRWDPVIDDYVSYQYESILGGWQPGVPSLKVGEAAFVFKAGTAPVTWTRNFQIQQ
jgi:hypothetical protein